MPGAAGALALVAVVTASALTAPAAQARDSAPGVAAATAGQHTVYVARPTNVGGFSLTDDEVLAGLGLATDFWVDEADGRIAGFDVPDSPVRRGSVRDVRDNGDQRRGLQPRR